MPRRKKKRAAPRRTPRKSLTKVGARRSFVLRETRPSGILLAGSKLRP